MLYAQTKHILRKQSTFGTSHANRNTRGVLLNFELCVCVCAEHYWGVNVMCAHKSTHTKNSNSQSIYIKLQGAIHFGKVFFYNHIAIGVRSISRPSVSDSVYVVDLGYLF